MLRVKPEHVMDDLRILRMTYGRYGLVRNSYVIVFMYPYVYTAIYAHPTKCSDQITYLTYLADEFTYLKYELRILRMCYVFYA